MPQYYERSLEKVIAETSDAFRIVLVTGPRQVGKTSVFERCCAGTSRRRVTLDEPAARALAKNDPALFLQTFPPPLLIDEVQNAPELFPHLKMAVDRAKTNGQFWLTGSQAFPLMKHVSESLAGRVCVLPMQGLSQAERLGVPARGEFLPSATLRPYAEAPTAAQLFSEIHRGAFPQMWAEKKTSWARFYSSYVNTYLERDVRQIISLTKELSFSTFLRVLAARCGQMLNFSEMARDVGVSLNTVKEWVSVLRTSGLIFLLEPYFSNLTKRAVKTPKVYFFDTGLVAYLTGQSTPEALMDGPMRGAIFETYVISEILKSYMHAGVTANFYCYRDTTGREIDLLIERDGKLHPVEVKLSANPSAEDARHFSVLRKIGVTTGAGAVVCLRDEAIPLCRDVIAAPIRCI